MTREEAILLLKKGIENSLAAGAFKTMEDYQQAQDMFEVLADLVHLYPTAKDPLPSELPFDGIAY